jgi:hypothetical protein
MRRPQLDRSSAAGDSLVGTLLALGLLLAMVTTGVALMASTQGRPETAAQIRIGTIAFQPCPTAVTDAAQDAATLRCAGVSVSNSGEADGLARCSLLDGARGVAIFDGNGTHVTSVVMSPGATNELLVRIEGAHDPTLPMVECTTVPLLTD